MAEAPHNMLSSSGNDEEFVNEVNVEEDLICFICKLTLREPVQTRCGHRFCNACLEELFRRYVLLTGFEKTDRINPIQVFKASFTDSILLK